MGEHLGAILRAVVPERLDPLGRTHVQVGAARARDLPVRDVAHEHVAHRVLRLPRHRGTAVAADELLALERVQPLLGVPGGDARDRGDRAEPEDLPHDGRRLQHAPSRPARARRGGRR